jgi:choline dehydrogenase-like flavoprotein
MHVVTRNTRVHLRTGVEVMALDIEGGRVVGVRGRTREGEDYRARGSLVVLGANAIFNAAILLRSAPEDEGPTGRGLSEQASVRVTAHTRGLKNFDGSTYQTGHGYMAHDGPHRRTRAAALLETHNAPRLRNERDRWRDIAHFKLIFEELPRAENRVTVDGDEIPAVEFHRFSENTERGLARAREIAERILAPLPVERIEVSSKRERTEAHIMCTTPMGNRPDTSVVDADLVHHRFRNVLVTGASVFPTAACANPTLTLCALSLRAADRVLS